MNGMEILLGRRWVLKSEDKELYYRVRDSLGEIRDFASKRMGCQIIENALLVKMEKIPAVPEDFMGISEFTSQEEYATLCILLMFLEDKEAQEQFILSQLTEYISANMPGKPTDWTLYTSRRRLIRVLRYAVSQGLLCVTDGREEAFMEQEGGEVLYENTGASRYFMRNFSRDIMQYTSSRDFEESEWYDMDEERGIARRQRVYKRLLFAPGMYDSDGYSEDFEYLKYYGRRLIQELETMFDCRVHIHRGSAYFLAGEGCRMGVFFPGNNVLSDIVLLCLGAVQERIRTGVWSLQKDERCVVDDLEFTQMLREVRETNRQRFSKNFREMPEGEFVRVVTEEMERWMFLRRQVKEGQILIYPQAGKIAGHYL